MDINSSNLFSCESGEKYDNHYLKKTGIFLIGYEIFYNEFVPYYNNAGFDINRLLEFEISLPFHIALEDKSLFNFTKDNCILHYIYNSREYEEIMSEHNDLPVKRYYTSVYIGISYNSDLHKEESRDDIHNILFDYSLEELNKQIIAYMISTKDDRCYRVTKEMLFPIVVMNTVNLDEIENDKNLFLLHGNLPYKYEHLNQEEVFRYLEIYNIYDKKLNPIIHSELYLLKAKRNFKEGYYDDAVISIQTNIEILIRIIYREVLICSGISDLEIEKIFEDESFMTIVKKKLSKYIGGIWDTTKEGTAIYNWYNKTYKMRNKVVHSGYFPTFSEADMAIGAALEFRKYLLERVRKNNKTYTKLNKYFK